MRIFPLRPCTKSAFSSAPSKAQTPRLTEDSHFRPPVLLMVTCPSYLRDEAITLQCPSDDPSLPTDPCHLMLSSPPHCPFSPVLRAITRLTILKCCFNWLRFLMQNIWSKSSQGPQDPPQVDPPPLVLPSRKSPPGISPSVHYHPVCRKPSSLSALLDPSHLTLGTSSARKAFQHKPPATESVTQQITSKTVLSPKYLPVLLTLSLLTHCLGHELSLQRNWVARFSK